MFARAWLWPYSEVSKQFQSLSYSRGFWVCSYNFLDYLLWRGLFLTLSNVMHSLIYDVMFQFWLVLRDERNFFLVVSLYHLRICQLKKVLNFSWKYHQRWSYRRALNSWHCLYIYGVLGESFMHKLDGSNRKMWPKSGLWTASPSRVFAFSPSKFPSSRRILILGE